MTRPPYVIPSMAEIAALPRNGLQVISTFSGCGGSSLGYKMAGYTIAAACEINPEAREVYEANYPGVPIDPRSVRDVSPSDLLDLAGIGIGDLDVFDGSPPCDSFSTAGKRQAHWGSEKMNAGTMQRTDDLFFEYARLVDGIQPKVFVAENVTGLVKGAAKGYFLEILRRLRGCGYNVQAKVLDASWLGCPQARQRLIFIGVRSDLGTAPVFPTPLPYRYTIKDALPWLESGVLECWGLGSYADRKTASHPPTRSIDQPMPTITGSGFCGTGEYELRVIHDTSSLAFSMGDVTDGALPTIVASRNNYQVHGPSIITHDPETGYRLTLEGHAIAAEYDKLDRPAPTVLAGNGNRGAAGITHPTQRRKFTLLELRRLSGFPDDFILSGSYKQRWERIGLAVVPPMMAAVGRAIEPTLLATKVNA